ncbi:MAG: hypothetical protein KDJ80_10240 [Nitratireductor sp.]|nr:hypothetical protein [Nitratireductor sp.]
MKLDEYVKQTLLDITNGVERAQRESLLFIAPGSVNGEKIVQPQTVKFEVVVTVNKESGGGISVFSIGDLKMQGSSENINKISFEVPIYLNAPTPLNPMHHSRQEPKDSE